MHRLSTYKFESQFQSSNNIPKKYKRKNYSSGCIWTWARGDEKSASDAHQLQYVSGFGWWQKVFRYHPPHTDGLKNHQWASRNCCYEIWSLNVFCHHLHVVDDDKRPVTIQIMKRILKLMSITCLYGSRARAMQGDNWVILRLSYLQILMSIQIL